MNSNLFTFINAHDFCRAVRCRRPFGQVRGPGLLIRHVKQTIVGGFYPRCRRRSKCWSIFFGKKTRNIDQRTGLDTWTYHDSGPGKICLSNKLVYCLPTGRARGLRLLRRHAKQTIVGGFYPRCRRRSKCWSIFFGKKHGVLTKAQASTLRPTMTAALERTAYRRFEVVEGLSLNVL